MEIIYSGFQSKNNKDFAGIVNISKNLRYFADKKHINKPIKTLYATPSVAFRNS